MSPATRWTGGLAVLGMVALASAAAPAKPDAQAPRTGDLKLRSTTGLCTVTLDGVRLQSLPLPGADGFAHGGWNNLAPGRHTIRVGSFFTWYEGTVDVIAGELLEIRVEPHQFQVSVSDGC